MEKAMISYNDLFNSQTLTYHIARDIRGKFIRAQKEANHFKELDVAFTELLRSKKEISFDDWQTIKTKFQNTNAPISEIIREVFNEDFT